MRGPVVAYTSFLSIASNIAPREFSLAQTATAPSAAYFQPWRARPSSGLPLDSWVARFGRGSLDGNLLKKLSSRMVDRPVWVSVEPIMPNL